MFKPCQRRSCFFLSINLKVETRGKADFFHIKQIPLSLLIQVVAYMKFFDPVILLGNRHSILRRRHCVVVLHCIGDIKAFTQMCHQTVRRHVSPWPIFSVFRQNIILLR